LLNFIITSTFLYLLLTMRQRLAPALSPVADRAPASPLLPATSGISRRPSRTTHLFIDWRDIDALRTFQLLDTQ
jgi:hypothetical protein